MKAVFLAVQIFAVASCVLASARPRPRRSCGFQGNTDAGDFVLTCASHCACTAAVSTSSPTREYVVAENAHATINCAANGCIQTQFVSNGSLVVTCDDNSCTQATFQTGGTSKASLHADCTGANSCNSITASGAGIVAACSGTGSCTALRCGSAQNCPDAGQCPPPPPVTVTHCGENGESQCTAIMGSCVFPNGTFILPAMRSQTNPTTVSTSEPETNAPETNAPANTEIRPGTTQGSMAEPSTASMVEAGTAQPAGSHPSGTCPNSVGSTNSCKAWCGPSNFMMWSSSSFTGSGGNTGGYTCKCANNNLCTLGNGGSFNGGGGSINIGGNPSGQGGQGGQGGKGGSSTSISISTGGIVGIVVLVLAICGYVGYRYSQKSSGSFDKLDNSRSAHENLVYEETSNGQSMSTEYTQYP